MPNVVGPTGITIVTRAEALDTLINGNAYFPGFLSIYGSDINLDPNTPDGNWLNLLAQLSVDYAEFAQQIYNSWDPTQSIGVNLDRCCSYNGVKRQAGTYTSQQVTVTATQALTLPGLDAAPTAPFSVADANGNKFDLISSYSFGSAGSANLNFQAEKIGAIIVASNSLTTIATPTLGINSVTNGTLSGTTGNNEETDAALRRRRTFSVSIPSKGYLDGLEGNLLAIAGVTDAKVFENNTPATVGSIPANTIWPVIAGGNTDEIANVINEQRTAGGGLKGSVTVSITNMDGTPITIQFDRPTIETLWINFNLTAISGSIDAAYVKTQIATLLSYRIGDPSDASAITALVKQIAPNGYVDSMGVNNTNSAYVAFKATTDINYQWGVDTSRILINGA